MKKNSTERTNRLDAFRLYSLADIEPVLGVSRRTLLTYVKSGRLQAVKVGGKWKVSEKALETFIKGGNRC